MTLSGNTQKSLVLLRSKEGGLRCGEMERDTLIAHGISRFTKERLMDMSDAYTCHVCDICGLFATRKLKLTSKKYPQSTDTYYCMNCKGTSQTSQIALPYAAKLLFQELMAMNIAPRLFTE